MGKARKPRYRSKKSNPVGIPSLRDISLNEELNGEEHPQGALAAIHEQLQSGNIEEKMCGLQAMAFLSLNQKKAQAMCEADIIRIAIPLLVHPNKNIRNAVAGALRNVSICGVDVCEQLVEQDILTPLLTLINEYTNSADWIPVIDRSIAYVDQLDIAGDTFLQAINLVWNLCESTAVALQHFNQTNILANFVRFLNYSIYGIDICKLIQSVYFIFLFEIIVIQYKQFLYCVKTNYVYNIYYYEFYSCCGGSVLIGHFRRQSSFMAGFE